MNLSNIVIILDHPDEPRNIGAACRAMANNDIKTLRSVGKKDDYTAAALEHIKVLAIHASYIFDNVEFFDSINDATKDCCFSAGTTRRFGKKRGKLLLPEEFAKMASETTDSEQSNQIAKTKEFSKNNTDYATNGAKVAVIFGNERTGLTDDQLEQCTLGVTIPSSDEFGSLNLSHAVQILCYHLYRQKLSEKNPNYRGYTPLSLQRIDKSVEIITDNLKEIGFFKMPGREDMENFWRSILSRASLSEGEAQYLEKIFVKAAGLCKKQNNDK